MPLMHDDATCVADNGFAMAAAEFLSNETTLDEFEAAHRNWLQETESK